MQPSHTNESAAGRSSAEGSAASPEQSPHESNPDGNGPPVDSVIAIRAEKWVQQGFCLGYLPFDHAGAASHEFSDVAPNDGGGPRGFPVFLHGALPGEEVQARITRSNNRHCFALVLEVLSPAAARMASDCPVFPRCGGCSFRHIDYAEEVELKLRLLDELKFLRQCIADARALERFKTHTAAPDGYRTRARLHRTSPDAPPGFYELHSNCIVPIPETVGCRQLAPDLNEAALQERAPQAQTESGDARTAPQTQATPSSKQPQPKRHHTLQLELEDPVDVDGRPWRVPGGAFFQANQYLLNDWLASARSMLELKAESEPQTPAAPPKTLELFCGSGLLGGSLRGMLGEYQGYDNSATGLKAARKNFKLRGYAGRFENRDLYRRPMPVPPETKLALINPPRAGMNQRQIPLLAEAGVDRILYSSCNPATLNRDLGKFLERGYAARAVEVFDFFPRTPHLEVLILLEREPGTRTMTA